MKKICVISGGASGLGLALAENILKSGRNVLILGRHGETLVKAAKKLNRLSESAHASTMICNIGNEEDVRKTGKFLHDHKILVEYLFNNAGMGHFAKAETTTAEMIDRVFEANLKGMILLTSEILRITPEKEELTIVNVMSTSSLVGRDEETIYCAAKWGARGFTEALRTEMKSKKRNIIAVYPGGMRTNFWKVPGQYRDISGFMDPGDVAEKIVNAVFGTNRLMVTDITINRKK